MENLCDAFQKRLMNHIFSVYLACTIFGVGVTMIDMLGILGDLFHEGGSGTDSGDDGAEHGEAGDHGEVGDDGDEGDDHVDHEGGRDATSEHGEKGTVSSHEHYQERHLLIGILSIARSLVHFSVGFGPVGLVALATGRGSASSLAWSVPVGVLTLVVGRVLRRIQRSELDSQLRDEDLIMEQGIVTVSIRNGQLGKVRIHLEGTYAERFARARNPQEHFPVGSPIRIVDIADECVYVEKD